MTAETSNARGEWVLVPRVPSAGMLDSAENAMIESEWAYNAGEPDARSDAHGFPTMRIWQAVVAYRAMLSAAPTPADARVDVRGLVAKLAAHVRPTCSELWDEAQAFLAAEGVQAEPNAEARGVVDGWRLVVRYGEYDSKPSVWAEKDGSLVRIATFAGERNG